MQQEPSTSQEPTTTNPSPPLSDYWRGMIEEWERQRAEEEARDPDGGLVISL